MQDNTSPDNTPDKQSPVDLSELQNLSFGPAWTSSKRAEPSRQSGRSDKADRRPPRRDRRPPRSQGQSREESRGGSAGKERRTGRSPDTHRDKRRGKESQDSSSEHPAFRPIVNVMFYPEDTPFKALCHALKSTCRTYELFEIARLLLEKPERFVAVVKPVADKESGPQHFYLSVPDSLPFVSEEEAVSHVLKNHLDRFFTSEEVEVDPPKGTFQVVSKCGLTGEILGPPNYHRYQTLLQEHYNRTLTHVSYEKFLARIETVREESEIQSWVDKMKRITRYTVNDPLDPSPRSFDNIEGARAYLLGSRKEQIVRKVEEVRFPGRLIAEMPKGELRRSVEAIREHQSRFPLDTANNLRGRLRRMRFTVYKKGSKGISYVCAVKRKFRDPDTVFSDSIQELISFIEKHPEIPVSELPEKLLGIQPRKAPQAPKEKAPEIESVTPEQIAAIEEPVRGEPLAETGDPAGSNSGAKETPLPRFDAEDDQRLKQLMIDLHWLITEGYVTEYADGKLYAPAPLPLGKHPGEHEDSDDSDEHHEETVASQPAPL